MKVFKWKPTSIAGDDGETDLGFTGTVDVEIPNYKERVGLLQEMNLGDDVAGAGLAAGGKMIELVEKQVKAVNLKHEVGGVFTSIEDLSYNQEGSAVINELGKAILGGISLGNV